MAFSKEEAILDNKISGLDTRLTIVESFIVSPIDADTLDGLDSTQFLRSDTSDTMTGTLTVTGNILSSDVTYDTVSDWGTRHTTPNGYIQFGPANTSYGHIYTDRAEFYFNKEIRINNNQVWHAGRNNTTSGTITTTSTSNSSLVTSGGLQANGSISRFGGTGANTGVIHLDTRNAGSPQISMSDGTTSQEMSWAIGGDDGDNNFKIHGNASATIPTINNLADPHFEINCADGYITTKMKTIWTGNTNSAITVSSYLPSDIDGANLLVEWNTSSTPVAGDTTNLWGTVTWIRGKNCSNTALSSPSSANNDTYFYITASNALNARTAGSASTINRYVKSIAIMQAYKY